MTTRLSTRTSIDVDALLDMTVRHRVAHLRARRGWSQQYMADVLGRSKSWVDKVERGTRGLDRLSVLRELENLFDCPGVLTAPQRDPGTSTDPIGARR